MKQIYLEDKTKVVGLDSAEQAFEGLIGAQVSSWYRVIGSIVNIHFGEIHEEEGKTTPSYDFSIYIDGKWEILKSGVDVVSDYDPGEEIDDFIGDNPLGKVVSCKLFSDLELFIDFSSGFTIHILPETEAYEKTGWVGIHKFADYALHLKDIKRTAFARVPIELE